MNERDSNIELFRIIVMISIVAHHLVVNTGLSYELLPEIHSVRNVYLPHTHWNLYPYYFVADSNALLALPTSLSLFMCFRSLNIGQHLWINRIAAGSFGVLLFHNAPPMKYLLFDVLFKAREMWSMEHYVLSSLAVVLIVYVMGTLFDMIRIYFFEKPLFKKLNKIEYKSLC